MPRLPLPLCQHPADRPAGGRRAALLPERGQFMKGVFAWARLHRIGVPYDRRARMVERLPFRPWRLWNTAIDGLASFSTAPLRVWTYVGAAVAALCHAGATIVRTVMVGWTCRAMRR